MKVLFLSHYHKDAEEIGELATELRLRGIVPWVDKDRGFILGDDNEKEARRVVREESFGLLLYATGNVFERQFIRRIEIAEAKRMKEKDPNYLLVAIPRSIDFKQLEKLSKNHFHINLSDFHTIEIPGGTDIRPVLGEISRHVLCYVLDKCQTHAKHPLSLQISTRELLPDEHDDVLRIDASRLFRNDNPRPDWDRFLNGLIDIKKEIAIKYGRPHLKIHGSKHLTAAFVVGRVFSPFQMEIKQGSEIWKTDGKSLASSLKIKTIEQYPNSEELSVEISTNGKKVSAAVDRLLSSRLQPGNRIQCMLNDPLLGIDGPQCIDIIRQVRGQIEKAVGRRNVRAIHIFAAVPQGLMIMLGREFGPLPSVQLYEFDGNSYTPSLFVPSGAL